MHAKHFVDDPADLILDSLKGLVLRRPGLLLDHSAKVVYRNHTKAQVALISGGGSGHEPAHAGFVADGMLSAAVCGSVFASPNASQIRRGISLVNSQSSHGTLLIVKNYTGDVLNFGLAKERYLAEHQHSGANGLRMVVVADDVAVGRTQSAITGRRGLAGTVLVHKIAGALAATGAPLDEVHAAAEQVVGRLATIGVGGEHVHVPGTAVDDTQLQLKADEIEIGMGIHNEPGASRLSPAPPLSQLIKTLVDHLTSTTDPERSFLPFVNTADPRDHNQDQDQTRDQVQAQVQDQANDTGADQVVLLVNNLGGTSPLELDAIARAAFVELQSRKIHVVRIVVGTLMTSLGMPGFSLTLLLLPRSHGNETDQKDYAEVLSAERILELLDAPTGCPAWPGIVVPHPWTIDSQSHSQDQDQAQTQAQNIHTPVPVHNTPDTPFIAALTRAAHALIAAEPVITRYDTIAGDGDCGATLKAGAEGVLTAIARGEIGGSGNKEGVSRDVLVLARVAEERMGGTSGALYSIFLAALAAALGASSASMARGASASDSISTSASVSTSTSEEQIAVQMWAQAGQTALQKLYTYTRARPPSRTLVDPLAAFLDALGSVTEEGGNSDNGKVDNRVKIAAAVRKAGEAAEKTRELEAKAGRAAYVEEGRLKEDGGMPDPGAWGVKVLLEGLLGDN